jgi:FkbM family methyltransferase
VKKNCAYNNKSNIRLIEVALGDEDGEAMIYSSEEDQNAISSLKPGEHLKKQGIPIQIRSGVSLIAQQQATAPTVVKMDVEGAEYQALKGMREALERPECRFLFLELHPQDLPRFGASEDQVRELLQQVGFNIEKETQRGTEMHLFCSK